MKKSARVLGKDYGLTAQEMNFILKEEGYLEGDPGNYFVTEKGGKYAEEQNHSRGVGGYSMYNRSWTTRTWDEEIVDELGITENRKKDIRQAISISKQKRKEIEDKNIAFEYDIYNIHDADTMDANNEDLVEAVGAFLIALSAYGVYKATPYIKQWWFDKVVPGLKIMKEKLLAEQKNKRGD